MQFISETCRPRNDLLQGSFNPEVFTASLSQTMDFYRGKAGASQSVYTDADVFFREATYPTQGLKDVVLTVMKRLSGDSTVQSIRRLETAFGGGKTHTLIALTHLAFNGKNIAGLVKDIVPEDILPAPGEIHVVGIAGDRIPVHKTVGAKLVPYTLWGEIAFQIGGEELYKKVETIAGSFAAPGEDYFDIVFGGRKVLIMFDELAQYAARFQAAQSDGAEMLAAFLMRLHGYARDHSGIAVVLALAGRSDAFARQTKRLAKLISEVKGEEVEEDMALVMAQDAEKEIKSVVARDATVALPVHANEMTRVLSKRLFEKIDLESAATTIDTYMDMYKSSASILPDAASRDAFKRELEANYPFHPEFVRFLNEKAATVENFQGTRGVLRTLAAVVQNIWKKGAKLPLIHLGHVDLRDPFIVSEIINRTEGSELLAVLNADVGGPDSGSVGTGLSRAQLADQENPHPEGYPLYEFTWRAVFLHSLVGRSEGIKGNLFGIMEPDVLFSVSAPGMTPPQVAKALEKITDSALYLKFENGKYFASLEPTINKPLGEIRASLKGDRRVEDHIASVARGVVKTGDMTFKVLHDVTVPEDIPDDPKKAVLALISLMSDPVKAWDFVTATGPNKPRLNQNLVFLLVPKTVEEVSENWNRSRRKDANDTMSRIESLARHVLAMKILKKNPESYGILPHRLAESDLNQRLREREQGLSTIVSQAYDSLWYPSASGAVTRKEIKTAGGEGGALVIEQVKKALLIDGEIIPAEKALQKEMLFGLIDYFFQNEETPTLEYIRDSFARNRPWPILEEPGLLDQMFREGVSRGAWCLFNSPSPEQGEGGKPGEFYCYENGPVPSYLDLKEQGWAIVSETGAKQRKWWPEKEDIDRVEISFKKVVKKDQALKVPDLVDMVCQDYEEATEDNIYTVAEKLVGEGEIGVYTGTPEQDEKPADLIVGGKEAESITIKPDQVVAHPDFLLKKRWVEVVGGKERFEIYGKEGAKKVIPILGRIGGFYGRGATSKIDMLSMAGLDIEGGGKVQITLEDVTPEGMLQLDEFFDLVKGIVKTGDDTEVDLIIEDVDENCPLIKCLKDKE